MRSQQQPAPQATPQAAPQTTIPVEVKVVNVLATVRKKKGEIVRNLTKDDFALEEDGRPQTIRYFAQETDLPLTLGLLVDTSGSQRRVLDQERSASSTFLDQVLRVDKDQAFVIHFDREVELLQDLTSSRQKLDAALQSLQTPQFSRQGGGSDSSDSQSDPQQGSHRRGGGGGGTLLYDAVYLASNELMMKQTGRKALIVLSDGVDHGSKETLASAIEAAQRADTLVYSILFKAEQEYGNGGFGGRGGGMGGRGGMVATAAVDDTRSNCAQTVRRSWNGSPRRRADASLRFPRRNRSSRFTTACKKNCATNTASGTLPTRRIPGRAITKSPSPQERATSSCKPETDTTSRRPRPQPNKHWAWGMSTENCLIGNPSTVHDPLPSRAVRRTIIVRRRIPELHACHLQTEEGNSRSKSPQSSAV